MLLKFSSSNILSTSLIDAHSGELSYKIATSPFYSNEPIYTTNMAGVKNTCVIRRKTVVTDSLEREVEVIEWSADRIPISITVMGERMDMATLFNGSEAVDFACASVSSVPTYSLTSFRPETGVVVETRMNLAWVAKQRSLHLQCITTGDIKSTFHHNCRNASGRIVPIGILGSGSHFFELRGLNYRSSAEALATFFIVEIMRRRVYGLSLSSMDRTLALGRPARSLLSRLIDFEGFLRVLSA
ncbi:hypothetical protein OF83DRAFT_1113926 [Amylostereum chailletii]|nr:hypothetical protein OF83DRAFT_1113926 [Amylostereum chailletii]